jgi:hypothetical protein
MSAFSFYTYQGSLTTPPCNEQTIHYVASEPIGISSTVIELFKEALRTPDLEAENGSIIKSPDGNITNNRKIQPLNGRPVFWYNHKKYNCPTFHMLKKNNNDNSQQGGHYERRQSTATTYFYVESPEPSGLPGAFVVSDKEALGHEQD